MTNKDKSISRKLMIKYKIHLYNIMEMKILKISKTEINFILQIFETNGSITNIIKTDQK